MTILVTGGAGFIGSNFVLDWCLHHDELVVNLDKLTYAGHLNTLNDIKNPERHCFVQGDILDKNLVAHLLTHYSVRAIVHFAAESHVDRSIHDPEAFIQTNTLGTFRLLEVARCYWEQLDAPLKHAFRFLHVSTDEVFGSLGVDEPAFTENNCYQPNSPYSASKAASDHFVRAFHHTYGLPVLTTNCSNNYGPNQFPEKLIPLCIERALSGQPIPIYGDGQQIRDWLYVMDHCRALQRVLERGCVGEMYNVGGVNEVQNLTVVQLICQILDQQKPRADGRSYAEQITHVQDRSGHDVRYAMDTSKIQHTLHWQPLETFETGLIKTVVWYLENQAWVSDVLSQNTSKSLVC